MAITTERVQIEIEVNGNKALAELNELTSESVKLRKQLSELTAGTKEYAEVSKRLKEVQDRQKEIRKEVGLTALPLKDLRKQYQQLNREIAQLTPGTDEFIKKSKQLQEVRAQMSEVNAQIRGTQSGLKSLATRELDAVKQAITGAFAASGILFLIDQLIKLTQFIFNVTGEFQKLEMQIKRFSNLAGQALIDTTVKAKSIADTFDKDVNEVILATNNFAQQMGIGFDEALTLVEKGFLQGADAGDDFLQKVKEYPVQLKNAGFSAEEFVQIATQEIRGGIFNDKLLDSLKELGLSVELTSGTLDLLKKQFGEDFTKQFQEDIATGAITAEEGFLKINAEAKKAGLTIAETQSLTKELFAGAGEDAGGFATVVENVNKALDINIDKYDELGQRQKATLDLTEQYNQEIAKLTKQFGDSNSQVSKLIKTLQILGLQLLNRVVESAIKTWNEILLIFREFQPVIDFLTNAFTNLSKQFPNISERLQKLLTGFLAIGNTVEIVKTLIASFSALSAVFSNIGERAVSLGKVLQSAFNLDFEAAKAEYERDFASLGEVAAKAYNDKIKDLTFVPEPDTEDQEAAKTADEARAQAEAEAEKKRQEEIAARRERFRQQQLEEVAKQAEKVSKLREEEAAKELEKQQMLQDLQIQLMEEGTEKQVAEIKTRYDRLIAAESDPAIIEALKEVRNQQIIAVEQEGAQTMLNERLKALEENAVLELEQEKVKLLEKKLALEELEFTSEEEKFNRLLELDQEHEEIRNEIEQANIEQRLALLRASSQTETEEFARLQQEKLQSQIDANAKAVENEERTAQLKSEVAQASADFAKDIIDFGIDLLGADEEARKKNGAITKTFALAKMAIDLQQEIAGYNAHPANTASFGAAGAVKTAAALLRFGIATAKVASQSFATGGILSGPLHSQGGMPILNPRTGQKVAEVEGGEAILSRSTVRNNTDVVGRLLYSSQRLGGAPIRYQDGGIVPELSNDTTIVNTTTTNNQTVNQDSSEAINMQKMILSELKKLTMVTAQKQQNIKAVVSWNDIEDAQTRILEDNNDASFS